MSLWRNTCWPAALALTLAAAPAQAKDPVHVPAGGPRLLRAIKRPLGSAFRRLFRSPTHADASRPVAHGSQVKRRTSSSPTVPMVPKRGDTAAGKTAAGAAPFGGVGAALKAEQRAATTRPPAARDPQARFDRRFYTADDLKRLAATAKAKQADLFTFQTGNKQVARSYALKPTGSTNPNVRDEVCLFRGFASKQYGEYVVIFSSEQLKSVRPVNGPEWRHYGKIDHEGVGYTTVSEARKAGLISW